MFHLQQQWMNLADFGYLSVCFTCFQPQALVARTYHPLFFFSNFPFTNFFSIKFLYFFIISSLFPYFNLFVSIFTQSYANNNLHVSTLQALYRYVDYQYLYRVNTCKLVSPCYERLCFQQQLIYYLAFQSFDSEVWAYSIMVLLERLTD